MKECFSTLNLIKSYLKLMIKKIENIIYEKNLNNNLHLKNYKKYI